MAKTKLELDGGLEFWAYGMSSKLSVAELLFKLNKSLQVQFSFKEDFQLSNKGNDYMVPIYMAEGPVFKERFFLFKNQLTDSLRIVSKKSIDVIILIERNQFQSKVLYENTLKASDVFGEFTEITNEKLPDTIKISVMLDTIRKNLD